MNTGRALVLCAAACTVALASCILLVSPPTGGDTCHFAGTESSCGACVAALCQPEVNGCCADTGCKSTLAALEACGTKQDTSCTSLQAETDAGSAAGGLSACVAQNCRGECQPFTGRSQTACAEPNFGQGSVCTCQLSDQPNDFACSPAVYPDTICCAPQGWPAVGLDCSCLALSCTPSQDGCFCMQVNYTPTEVTCGGSSGLQCCVNQDTCTCGSTACLSFQTAVPSCSLAGVGCASGQRQVASCSIRINASDGGSE